MPSQIYWSSAYTKDSLSGDDTYTFCFDLPDMIQLVPAPHKADIIIHCASYDEYDHLMQDLESSGYTWFSGDKPTSLNCWGITDVIIVIEDTKQLCFGSKSNYPNYVEFALLDRTFNEPAVEPDFIPPTEDFMTLLNAE